MIEFTIKTLDSNNHHFSVDDEITVQQLKERVRDTMGIEINFQRLIFCGRVLQDDKKLADYDVNGKVVHLVQRAPPSPEFRNTSHTPPNTTNSNTNSNPDQNAAAQQQIRRLMAMTGPPSYVLEEQHALSLSPTAGRMEFIQRMIGEIRISLASLRAHVDNESEPQLDSNGEEAPDAATRAQNARRRAIRALRARHSRPRDLGQLIEELDQLQTRFIPYKSIYSGMLKAASSPEPPQFSEEDRLREQRIVDMVLDIMHSFAHAYHAVSDINFQVGQRNPRLTSESILMRHPIPMQAHINVVQSNRRQHQNANAASGNGNGSSAPPQTSGNASQTGEGQSNQGAPGNQGAQTNLHAGRNTTQPTVNINIQPDPITYQLEIETRMPIAFALENALLNGLSATTATSNQQQQQTEPNPTAQQQQQPSQNQAGQQNPAGQQNQTSQQSQTANQNQTGQQNPTTQPNQTGQSNQTGQPNQTGQSNQTGQQNQAGQQSQTGQPNQTGQQGQSNRRQLMIDFEQLFRGLGQAGLLGGVEVVMSMEEIPQGVTLGSLNSAGNGTGGPGIATGQIAAAFSGASLNDGVFVGAMPWGGAPSADLLQNIVASVIRQGLLPHMEGTIHAQMPGQGQGQGQGQSQGQVQGQNQTQNQSQSRAQNPSQNQTQTQGQTQSQNAAQSSQGNQEQGNRQARQPNLHLRRATTTTRAQAVSLNNLIYDRYLQCDSQYARRRIQRRREQYQQQVAAQERLRAERTAAQNIETLRERNANISQNHIRTLVRLTNSPPSQQAWLNALMVTIARHFFLSELMQSVSGEEPLLPHEFRAIRRVLRSYIHNLIERSGDTEGNNAYQMTADFLIDSHSEFLDRMGTLTPLRSDVDVYASLRMLVRSRLPAVIAIVMSESTGEIFAARFYSTFARFFTDVCALITRFCQQGIQGMRTIFNTYLNEYMRDFDEAARDMLTTLATENLDFIANNLVTHIDTLRHFVRPINDSLIPGRPTPMEVSPPAPPAREEPMQTTPPPTPVVVPETSAPSTAMTSAMETIPEVSVCPVHASTSVQRNATVTSSSLAGMNVSSIYSPNRPAPRNIQPEKSDTQRNTTDNRRLPMSPMLIVQQWDEEWVPMFTRDQQAQRAEPQEPYSDAYLSGMPSRKRRCVRQARPPHNLNAFMTESIREASERTPAPENTSIRSAFREHMRNMARSRATTSEDYDPLRYVSAERFLNINKPNNNKDAAVPQVPQLPQCSKEPK